MVATTLDRQRELAAYSVVKRQRQAAELQEAKLRATETSLARKLYSKLTPFTGAEMRPVHPLRDAVAQFERLYISRVIAEVEGDALRAREILAVSRSAFYRYPSEYDLHHLVRKQDDNGSEDA